MKERSKRRWHQLIRFPRLTVVEWFVIVIIVAFLAALFLPATSSSVRLSEEDLGLNDWKPGPENAMVPDGDMRVESVDIAGEWTYRFRTILWIRPHKNDGCQVKFHSHHHGTYCELERRATYEQGVLVLNRPVKEIPGPAYQKLYTVQIDGEDFLLPSARVKEFQEGRAVDWSRYDKHDLLERCVLHRSLPGQCLDEHPFAPDE